MPTYHGDTDQGQVLTDAEARLTDGLVAMSQLKDMLRVRLRAPVASASQGTLYSDTELYQALGDAMSKLSGHVRVAARWETTIADNERDYELPAEALEVSRVRRRGSLRVVQDDGALDDGEWVQIDDWDHLPALGQNLLHLSRLYSDDTELQVDYLASLPVLPTPQLLGTTMDSVQVTATLADPWLYPGSGIVQVEEELLRYTGISGTALTGLTRGWAQTTAAAHTAAAGVYVDPCVALRPAVRATLLVGAQVEALRTRLGDRANADSPRILAQLQDLEKELDRSRPGLGGPRPSATVANLHPYRAGRRRPGVT